MATSIMDIVRAKKQAIQAESGRRDKTHKPQNGKNRYRILPGWRKEDDPTFYHDFGQHFIKNTEGELQTVYVCSEKTFNNDCPICREIQRAISSAKDDSVLKALTEAKSKGRVLMNALHRDGDNPDAPVILDLTPGTFAQVLNIMEEWGDITSLDEGIDIVIERSGKGINTEYNVQPAAKSKPVPASVLDKLYNLDEYVQQEFDAGKNKALAALSAVAGNTGSVAGLLTSTATTTEVADDEVEFLLPPKSTSSKKVELSDELPPLKEAASMTVEDLEKLLEDM